MHKNWLNILFALIPISVIFNGSLNGIIIGGLSFYAVVVLVKEDQSKKQVLPLLLSFSLFGLLIFISFIDFCHGEFSLKILERYLPTLFIPLVWFGLSEKVNVQKVFRITALVVSSINGALMVFGVFRGFLINEKVFGVWSRLETLEFYADYNGGFNYIFLTYIKIIEPLTIDPAYYGLLVNIVIFILWQSFSISRKKIDLLLIGVNVIFIYLLASKANIISFGVLLVFYLLAFLNARDSLLKVKSLFIVLVLIAVPFFIPSTRLRIENSYETVLVKLREHKDSGKTNTIDSSTNERMLLWKTGLIMFLENPLVGWGNINGDFILKERSGIDKNSHNQFLKFAISGGVIALILLILYLFFPLKLPFIDKQLFFGFLIVIGFNLLFENILDRQWGLVLVPFFQRIVYRKTFVYDV